MTSNETLPHRLKTDRLFLFFPLIFFILFFSENCTANVALLKAAEASVEQEAATGERRDAHVDMTVIEGRVGRKPVYSELVSLGLAPAEVITLTQSFKPLFDFRKAQPTDEYQLVLTPENQLFKFIYKTDRLNQYVAQKTDSGGFRTFKKDIILEKQVVAKEFTLETCLSRAITDSGENAQLVSAFTDIFSWDIDFYLYPRKGDRIRVLFERYTREDRFVKYGKILSAEYIGQNGTHSAFLFENGETESYYDEQGHALRKMFLRVPVKFGVKTSSFSVRRFHPVAKKYKRHTGIDYGAPHGTPISATAGGKVTYAGWMNGYGKLVILQHANGYKTYYGHCSSLLVKKGEFVKQGDTIAKVGKTGTATGTHVHYEVRLNDTPINPNRLKSVKGEPLSAENMADFRQLVRERLLLVEKLTTPVEKSGLVYSIRP